ncbi:MAG: ferredoxin [Bacillota bacterium]
MKAYVDKDVCIGCGNCEMVCPGVFKMGSDGISEVIVEEIPEDFIECAQKAAEECPVSAITIE